MSVPQVKENISDFHIYISRKMEYNGAIALFCLSLHPFEQSIKKRQNLIHIKIQQKANSSKKYENVLYVILQYDAQVKQCLALKHRNGLELKDELKVFLDGINKEIDNLKNKTWKAHI